MEFGPWSPGLMSRRDRFEEDGMTLGGGTVKPPTPPRVVGAGRHGFQTGFRALRRGSLLRPHRQVFGTPAVLHSGAQTMSSTMGPSEFSSHCFPPEHPDSSRTGLMTFFFPQGSAEVSAPQLRGLCLPALRLQAPAVTHPSLTCLHVCPPSWCRRLGKAGDPLPALPAPASPHANP